MTRKRQLRVRGVALSSSPSKPVLRLDWCSHEAAKYACERWHYSGTIPKSKSVYVGAWENRAFVGVVIFGLGASSHLGSPYGIPIFGAAELTRVALTKHVSPVSRIVSIAMSFLAKNSPRLRLLISYADPKHGHHGGIYQAMGWLYVGKTTPDWAVIDKSGRQWHSRNCSTTGISSQFGERRRAMRPQDGTKITLPGKHKYLMPLDAEMRAKIAPLAKPYPKRERSIGIDAAGTTSRGRCDATRSLQPKAVTCA